MSEENYLFSVEDLSHEKPEERSAEDMYMGDGVLRLSASQINTYLRCPMQYYYSRVLKIKSKPALALVLGSSYHSALEHNLVQKIDTKVDRPLDEVIDVYSDTYDKGIEDAGGEIDKKEAGQEKDIGTTLVEGYHNGVAPTVQPVSVEKYFRLKIHTPHIDYGLSGYMDLIESNDIVIDHKTKGRMFLPFELETDLQMSIYSLAFRTLNDRKENSLRFDVAVKNKKKPEIILAPMHRTTEQIQSTVRSIASVAKSIKEGLFYKQPSVQVCSWCGYCEKCWGKPYAKLSQKPGA